LRILFRAQQPLTLDISRAQLQNSGRAHLGMNSILPGGTVAGP
jgi:hypothetical protein